MFDNQFFQFLVYSALILFNLFFFVALLVGIFTVATLGSIKSKLDEALEELKEATQKIGEAAESAAEAGWSLTSFLTPLAFFKKIFGPKKVKKGGVFSKFFEKDSD